jgi:hypothetical protein
MITVYNIRGTNGSGKSTLARAFIPGTQGYRLKLAEYPAPTKAQPDRVGSVSGRGFEWGGEQTGLATVVVGPYETACGGLDAVPNFETSFKAVSNAISMLEMHSSCTHRAVIAEGVLASTVWGSWGEFAKRLDDVGIARVAFCYLDTPLEVCLDRIRKRQEAAGKVRDIKTELVADKVKAIAATRLKALAAGQLVYDLPHMAAEKALQDLMTDNNGARSLLRARA